MHAKYHGKYRRSLAGNASVRRCVPRTTLQSGAVCTILIVAVVLVWYYSVSLMLAEGVL